MNGSVRRTNKHKEKAIPTINESVRRTNNHKDKSYTCNE